jgi:hypothetical protein
MTVKWYGLGLLACLRNDVDLEADTLKLSLHTSTYAPNLDTDDFFNDATNELGATNGYTAGGVTLTGKALSYDAATDQVRFDFDDPSFPFTGAKTWRYAVLRKARGGAASADELIALIDFGADQTVSTAYALTVDPAGLLYIDVT